MAQTNGMEEEAPLFSLHAARRHGGVKVLLLLLRSVQQYGHCDWSLPLSDVLLCALWYQRAPLTVWFSL